MATTMATSNGGSSSSAGAMHYSADLVNRLPMAESSLELTKRFAQMQLKTTACAPKRQPTIVCEDIADDDLIEEDEGADGAQNGSTDPEKDGPSKVVLRSASSTSLTVPISVCDLEDEKRRPPLPDHST